MTRILKTVLHFMDQSQMTSQQDFVINFNYEVNIPCLTKF